MGFIKCAVYAAFLGLGSFLLGRILPGSWFSESRFPFSPWSWEQGGTVYQKFGIRKWQAKVPDMSKIFPGLMQAKKVTGNFSKELPTMITETCIAEWIHGLLCLLIFPCLRLWPGWGGRAFVGIYILCNLPFMMIQRYNRPRLMRLRDKMMRNGKENKR